MPASGGGGGTGFSVPLNFSTGPAVSSAAGYDGNAATGAFNFKREPEGLGAIVAQVAPLALIGLAVWALWRK